MLSALSAQITGTITGHWATSLFDLT